MDREPMDTGRIFTVTQLLAAMTTAATDAVTLSGSTAAGGSRVEILKLELQQFTTAPLPTAVELWRGSTGGSTAAAITPVNRNGWPTAPAAVATVTGASTSVLNSTTSAARLHVGGFGMDSGQYCYEPCFPPVIDYSQRFHARFTAQSTEGALGEMAMTLTFREIGKVPG